jgi:hypothetical protein
MRPEALEAAMTVAPMVGPTARLANRGLMATGRAGERVAERVVPQIMERGGLPAELMQGMSRGTVSPLDVYHGSPYRLQPTAANPLGEFDASKIGTGAGAQRYGYGIYTSEAPQFADMFAIRKGLPDLEGIALQNGLELSQEARVELIRQATRDSMGKPVRGMKDDKYIDPIAAVKKLQNASIETRQMPADKLQNTIREFQEQNKAYLYKADLPDEKIAKMLDWDKPLTEQSLEVRKALAQYMDGSETFISPTKGSLYNPTGRQIYESITKNTDAFSGKGSNIAAEQLRQIGIPGVTYKDLDTRNFVTFPGEEKSMRILERNGETAASPFYQDPFPDTAR